jgi:glycosyltransferase involved in cell wall biosynthesis
MYNGVDIGHLRFSAQPVGYLVFLGRLCVEKRPDLAIEVARRLGMPIKIAAKIDAAVREWCERHVVHLLEDPLVDFLGEVGEQAKSELLGGATAMLFPTKWPEPFGMVMIEALACGPPVVALRYGSVPEVIHDGENGFICDTVDDMTRAVGRIADIDRRHCRDTVEERFTAARMAEGYEAAYARVVAKAARFPVAARTPDTAPHAGRSRLAPQPAALVDQHLDLVARTNGHLGVVAVAGDRDVDGQVGDT